MKAIECQRASGKFMGANFLRELRSVNTAVSLGSTVMASSCVLFCHYFSLRAEQVERLLSASCFAGVGCGVAWVFISLFTHLKKKYMRNAHPC